MRKCAVLLLFLFVSACVAPVQSSKSSEYRVAYFLADSEDDHGWNAAHVNGIRAAAHALGNVTQNDRLEIKTELPDGKVIHIRIIESNGYNSAEIERRMEDVIRSWHPNQIFATWFDSKDATLNMAKKYPEILFEHCSSYPLLTSKDSPNGNFSTYFVRMYQGDYVMGYFAGLVYPDLVKKGVVSSPRVGLVGTYSIPEPVRGLNAFALGYFDALPKGVKGGVDVLWINSWLDREKERLAAETLIDSNHDIIRQMADTPSSSDEAESAGKIAIGYGNDVSLIAPHALGTNVWGWRKIYEERMFSGLYGTWQPEDIWCGLGEDCVEVIFNFLYLTEDVKAEMDRVIDGISDGEIIPFSGPLTLYDGRGFEVTVPEGQAIGDMGLLQLQMFVEGVTGQVPTVDNNVDLHLYSIGK